MFFLNFFSKKKRVIPKQGGGGGVPHLGKIPTFSRFFLGGASLSKLWYLFSILKGTVDILIAFKMRK